MGQRAIRTKSNPRPTTIDARPLEKIALEVTQLLGDVIGRDLVETEAVTRSWIMSAIRDESEFFARWGYWHGAAGLGLIAKQAGELAGLIAEVETKLEELVKPLDDYLFKAPLARFEEVEDADLLARQAVADKAMLLDRLRRMRHDCQRQRRPPQIREQQENRAKDRSATLAHNLMRRLTKMKIVGSPSADGSSFYLIASLLYEAFTGKRGENLKRACDRVLKPRHEHRAAKKRAALMSRGRV
jgi:hypothetical protein